MTGKNVKLFASTIDFCSLMEKFQSQYDLDQGQSI